MHIYIILFSFLPIVPENSSFDENLDPDDNLSLNRNVCQYLSIDSFNALNLSDSVNFSILNQNSQSFHAKKSKLESFLMSLKHEFHSLIITETWNHENIIDLCHLDNFNAVHTFRQNSLPSHGGIGGGVSVFANSNLYKVRKIDELSICDSHIETCVAKIISKRTNFNCIILGVYRPPSGMICNFIDALEMILSHLTMQNSTIILAGDMNINISNENSNDTANYLSVLNSFGFYSVITLPTRFPNNSNNPTTLDHIFLNRIKSSRGIIFTYDISDHCGTSLFFEKNEPRQNLGFKTSFRLCSDRIVSSMEAALAATNWDILLNINDPNLQFKVFHDYIKKVREPRIRSAHIPQP